MVNMKKTMRAFSLFLFGLFFLFQSAFVWSQQEADSKVPVFACDDIVHDFGKIRETGMYAVHEFVVKNTGTAPLTISHVLSSCGCAQPEWSQTPIEPGQEGFVIVHYDMVDRPGPFTKNITVFTNEKTVRHVLTITGDVIPKPETLNVLFHDTIGTIQMERSAFLFSGIRPLETQSTEIWIQNFGSEDLSLVIENVPEYVTITAPSHMEKDFPERMKIEIDAQKVNENLRGRYIEQLVWKTESASGKTITHSIPLYINFIDDFRKMTPDERADKPLAQISTDILNYGKLKNKRVYKEFTISNKGKSPLNLHSITVDNSIITQISGFKKNVLQPEENLKIRVYVNPKEVKSEFTSDLYIISNDPIWPVQAIQLAFEK